MKKNDPRSAADGAEAGRVLARMLASDLRLIRGGDPGIRNAATGTVTEPPPGYDVTTAGADGDAY